MTREEALNTLMKMRAWRKWGKEQKEEERPEMPEQKEVDEAFDVCIKLLQSSIPSNLDEAAKKEIERFCSDMLNVDIVWARMQLTKRFGLQMAKFGAEWMAGQGITVGGTFHHSCGYPSVIELNTYLRGYEGKEVIVQIRKK